MEAAFERGDPDAPKGHALLYFRDRQDPEHVWATYVVVPPVPMDLAKYVPPMFAAQLAGQALTSPTAYPLPPVPERVQSHAYLLRLAELRDDDLLDAGYQDMNDVQRTLISVAEAGQLYASRCQEYLASAVGASAEAPPAADVDVDALLLQVMSDADRVGKLATLAGRLRYAVDGHDSSMVAETKLEMEKVARHLEDKFRPKEILDAASRADKDGARLAQLLIERAYRLAAEEYGALADLDAAIRELQSASPYQDK